MGDRGPAKEFAPEQFEQYIDEYISEYDDKIDDAVMAVQSGKNIINPFAIPSIHDFCRLKLHKSYKSVIYVYESDEDYKDIIAKLMEWLINIYHRLASVGLVKSTWLNFYMKNMHGWKEKIENTIDGKLNIVKLEAEDFNA